MRQRTRKANQPRPLVSILKKVRQRLRQRWLHTILLIISFSIVAGVTYAYFSAKAVSANLAFHTGSLKIVLTDPSQLSFADLKPGDKQTVDFSLKNSGNLPVYLKGKFAGGWLEGGLDNAKLQPTKLEYQLGDGQWVTLVSDGPALNSDFFYSQGNDATHLLQLASNQEIHWRATFQLAQDVNDDYQNQAYKVQIHFAAKQTNGVNGWPDEY